ncbi:hypothetical protein B7486_67125, partial [cyanobacterium TDX16]
GQRRGRLQILNEAILQAVPGLRVVRDAGDPVHVFLQALTRSAHVRWADTKSTADQAHHPLSVAIQGTRVGAISCREVV